MSHQISKKVKTERLNNVLETQKWISLKKNKEFIGHKYECIVEKYDEETNKFYGRTYAFAPDDIDGIVIIDFDENIILGDINIVEVYDVDFYDIYARLIK